MGLVAENQIALTAAVKALHAPLYPPCPQGNPLPHTWCTSPT